MPHSRTVSDTEVLRLTLLIHSGKNRALSESALRERRISIRIRVNLVSSVHSGALCLYTLLVIGYANIMNQLKSQNMDLHVTHTSVYTAQA
jgi:hypothetical protein